MNPITTISQNLKAHRQAYLNKWSNGNALQFESDGHYEWMAAQIDGFTKVLEIGTGDGRATLAVAKRGHSIVSIDENEACVISAVERLASNNINVQYFSREKLRSDRQVYSIQYRYPMISPLEEGVLLMEGDLNNDPKLLSWLTANGPFDAILCWLIGTHDGRTFNTAIIDAGIKDVLDYRLYTQNQVYKVADSILRPGGILNIIDRTVPLDPNLLTQHIDSHNAQAGGTSLEYLCHEERSYDETVSVIKVEMVAIGSKDTDLNNSYQPKSLTSITFQKPML